jgi:hypothetical protein
MFKSCEVLVLEYAMCAGFEVRLVAREVHSDWRYTVNMCQQYFAEDINVDTEGGSGE